MVSAVSGIDDRHRGVLGAHQCGALLGVSHGDDVHVGGHGTDGVRQGLALGGGAVG